MRTTSRLARPCALLLTVSCHLFAQLGSPGQNTTPTPTTQNNGLQLYNFSIFSSYYSLGSPQTYSGYVTPQANLQGDFSMGGSLTVGWAHNTPSSNLSVIYSPSYTGEARYSQLNSLNHNLAINFLKTINRKWNYRATATGIVQNLAESFFQPAVFTAVPSGPVNFDALVQAALAGSPTAIAELAALLTGRPILNTPAQSYLFGNRTASMALSNSISYSPSTRLQLLLSVGASRIQYLTNSGQPSNVPVAYIIPESTAATASVGVFYSITPRTRVSVNLSTSRVFSRLQDAYTSTLLTSLGRNMGQHWFLEGNGGMSTVASVRYTYSLPTGPQWVAGGSVGYKTRDMTFLASAARSVGDAYGLGAASSVNATGAWTWKRPGAAWSMSASISDQQFQSGILSNTKSLQAQVAFNRRIARNIGVQTSYAYMQYAGSFLNGSVFSPYSQGLSAVRVGLFWAPDWSLLR